MTDKDLVLSFLVSSSDVAIVVMAFHPSSAIVEEKVMRFLKKSE